MVGLTLQSTFHVYMSNRKTSKIILLGFPNFWYYHAQIAKKKTNLLEVTGIIQLYIPTNLHQYIKFKKLKWFTHHIEMSNQTL